jgi:hypothetical protein
LVKIITHFAIVRPDPEETAMHVAYPLALIARSWPQRAALGGRREIHRVTMAYAGLGVAAFLDEERGRPPTRGRRGQIPRAPRREGDPNPW